VSILQEARQLLVQHSKENEQRLALERQQQEAEAREKRRQEAVDQIIADFGDSVRTEAAKGSNHIQLLRLCLDSGWKGNKLGRLPGSKHRSRLTVARIKITSPAYRRLVDHIRSEGFVPIVLPLIDEMTGTARSHYLAARIPDESEGAVPVSSGYVLRVEVGP
jgi:hypothetical protein